MVLLERWLLHPAPWVIAGVAAAAGLGGAASLSPRAAIVISVALAATIAILSRPSLLPPILAATVAIEVVSVEGATISRIVAPLALFVVIIQFARGRAWIDVKGPLLWAGAFSLWAIASGLWTTSVAGTIFLLGSLAIALVYMLSFASLVGSRPDVARVVWVLVLAAVVFGALSFPEAAGLRPPGLEQEGRSQGGIGDPNYFAATQLVALPLAIALAEHVKERRLRLGLYAATFLIMGSILASLSRGGLLGLGILLVLLAVVPFRLLFRSRRTKGVALLVVAVAGTTVWTTNSSELNERLRGTFARGSPAAQPGSGRLNLWIAARRAIEERPVTGIGYGAFPVSSRELLLTTPGVDLTRYELRRRGQPVHNSYLESFAELGIVGLVLYVGLLVSTGVTLRNVALRARRAGDQFAASIAGALLLGLVTWSVTSFFLSTGTSRVFWIIAGLSLALSRLVTTNPLPETPEHVHHQSRLPAAWKRRTASAFGQE